MGRGVRGGMGMVRLVLCFGEGLGVWMGRTRDLPDAARVCNTMFDQSAVSNGLDREILQSNSRRQSTKYQDRNREKKPVILGTFPLT